MVVPLPLELPAWREQTIGATNEKRRWHPAWGGQQIDALLQVIIEITIELIFVLGTEEHVTLVRCRFPNKARKCTPGKDRFRAFVGNLYEGQEHAGL